MSDAANPPPPPEEPKMDIHKPKPWHNWREFLKEVGTIVLGVGIALAAEQAVEHWREHRQYLADREAVRTELGLQVANLNKRNEFVSCLQRRLDEVSTLLDRAEAHQPFAAPSWIGSPNSRVIRTTSEADIARSNLFPTSEQQAYGLLYAWLRQANELQDQEKLAWSHLQPLEGRTSVPPEMIADMRAAVGEARMEADRIRTNQDWLRMFAARYDIPSQLPNEWVAMHPRIWPVCLPTTASRAEGERMMFDYIETAK